MSDRLRVLRVIARLNVGGPARHVTLLTQLLPERGIDSELVWGSVGPEEGEMAVPAGLPGTRLANLQRAVHPLRDATVLRDLTRLIRRRRPDIVHTHTAKAGALGRLAALRNCVPLVVHTFHGHVLEGYFSRPITRAFLEVERRLASRTDILIAVSDAVRDELLDLRIGRPDQWRVIPLGLDLSPLVESRIEPGEARQTLGLPKQGLTVGIVGRLTAIKDHETFLRTAARVASVHPDATFVVAGDGELRPALQRRAQELLGERCQFLGWVMDLPTLYGALDVVVLTSRNEGTPVALIEAAAAGRPVVATRVGGVEDVVRDGETGYLAPPGIDRALADHVMNLLSDVTLRDRLGMAGRAWVADKYSADRLADDMAELYRGALAKRRAADE